MASKLGFTFPKIVEVMVGIQRFFVVPLDGIAVEGFRHGFLSRSLTWILKDLK